MMQTPHTHKYGWLHEPGFVFIYKTKSIPYPVSLIFPHPTCLILLLTKGRADPPKRAKNKSGPSIAPTLLFRISKAASQGYMHPLSKNMKQQEENVYWSRLPTSQAEGKNRNFYYVENTLTVWFKLIEKINVTRARQKKQVFVSTYKKSINCAFSSI